MVSSTVNNVLSAITFLGAWALEKSLMRPSFFLYLQEIRKKRRHWYGCQSALRLYNRHNLCPCARPAHMGESEPCGREQAWVQVLQNSRSQMVVLRFTTVSQQDHPWRNPQRVFLCTNGLSATQNGRGIRNWTQVAKLTVTHLNH